MRKFALAIAVSFFGVQAYAQAPSSHASGPVGRYQIIQVTFETDYSGDTGSMEKSTSFVKIDTVTGKAWIYKAYVFKSGSPLLIAMSSGWDPIPEKAPDLLAAMQKQKEAQEKNGK